MKQRKAFTIIEVVLVLAIAGLIFLMVFIALPALQRSQRNTRRRQDMARIATAVNDYQANNNKLPFPDALGTNKVDNDFIKKYVSAGKCESKSSTTGNNTTIHYGPASTTTRGTTTCNDSDQFVDPDGTAYNIWSPREPIAGTVEKVYEKDDDTQPSFAENNHFIFALAKAKCSSTENKAELANGVNDFALFYLLEGGAVYCVDNQ
jgi:prepilin-type N-terminal cleavage/methylation domain-containing protein